MLVTRNYGLVGLANITDTILIFVIQMVYHLMDQLSLLYLSTMLLLWHLCMLLELEESSSASFV